MLSISEKLNRGFVIFKNNLLLVIILCLLSAILCVAIAPAFVKDNVPETAVNQELSISFGDIGGISAGDIINTLIWLLQFSILATALLAAAYIVKQATDQRLFALNRWRDWRFFIYASALPVIAIELWDWLNTLIALNYRNDLLANLIVTFGLCFLVIILAALFFDPEPKREDPIFPTHDKLETDPRWDVDKFNELGNNQNINNPQTAGEQIRPAEDENN
ncbi:MAG: hypothetical protein WC470_02095 [Candidatus Paceibacterota bacterium]